MRSYEDISGGRRGNSVSFRAERFRARDVFGTVPGLKLNADRFILQDISMSGLCALANPAFGSRQKIGERVSVKIDVDGAAVFEGIGEIARIDVSSRSAKLGIRLIAESFEIAELASRSEQLLLESKFGARQRSLILVSDQYRQFCADVLYFLATIRNGVARISNRPPPPTASAALFDLWVERIVPKWRALWYAGNEIVGQLSDDAERFAIKEFTELVLTPTFVRGAIWERSFEKPFGYPGDFVVMNMVYDWRREGADLVGQLFHRIGLEVAECIATRMQFVRQAIEQIVLETQRPSLEITSLGCGPAREIADYLERGRPPRPIRFNLVDPEGQALAYAYEHTFPKAIEFEGQVGINCLETSFGQLLRAGDRFDKLPPQDLIYSVGLTDYISDTRARRLIEALYASLAPGGQLIIGNMAKSSHGNLWPMEFICDWTVIYRDEKTMRSLVGGFAPDSVQIEMDLTKRVYLLTLRKDGGG